MARRSNRKQGSHRKNKATAPASSSPSLEDTTAPSKDTQPVPPTKPGASNHKRKLAPPPTRELWRNPRVQGILLFFLTILAYLPAFQAGFTWDDDITLTRNALVQLPEGLKYIWASKQATDYYPLTWTTFWIEWRLWGASPFGYHIVNVLLHALSSLVLWRIFLKIDLPGAWFAALLFAIHPFCVDSVVWISQRKNTLCMVFFFAAILAWLKNEDTKGDKWLLWSLAAFLAAILSKASVIGLPFILLALSWFRNGSLKQASILRAIPYLAISGLSAITTLWFQGKVLGYDADGGYRAVETIAAALGSSNSETGLNLVERLLITGRVFWFYVLKILVPTGIAMVYPKWPDPSGWLAALPTLLMIGAGIATWFFRKKLGSGLFTAFVCLIFGLFPVLGFFTMSYHYYAYVANHLGYIAVPSVIAIAVGYCAVGLPRLAKNSPQAPAVLACLIASIFTWQTWQRASLYQSPDPQAATIRLWQDNTEKVPAAAAAWNELGIAQGAHGDWEQALTSFLESIKVDGGRFSKPWNNLGTAHANLGNNEKALEAFRKATDLNPLEFDAWGNMGTILLRLNQPEEAIKVFDKTLELRPMSPATYHNKGLALARLGRGQEAAASLGRAAEMNSANPSFRTAYAYQLFRNENRAEALQQFLKAIELGTPNPDAYNVAAWILATHPDPNLRNGQQALAIAEQGLRVAGGAHIGLISSQAAALAELGRFEDAVALLQQHLPAIQSLKNPALADRFNTDIQQYKARQARRDG
ncbi:MAG: tetratricopeptide repeat protein [Verrucomicrobiota bacterium]